jgi:hypothetical protein
MGKVKKIDASKSVDEVSVPGLSLKKKSNKNVITSLGISMRKIYALTGKFVFPTLGD